MSKGATRISSGQYRYKGFIINCLGYYEPEHRICWEAVDHDGTGFAHAYTKREVMWNIDYEIAEEQRKQSLKEERS